MHSEPNLRLIERVYIGRPYGYGRLPVPPPVLGNPLGGPRAAESRPQPTQRDPEGSRPTDRARVVLDLIDLWDKFQETFKEIPGLWRSLLGLLVTPFRWLRVIFSLRGVLAVIGVVVILMILFLLAIPFMTSSGRDATRAEGEQLMGAARDFARVEYSKTGKVEDTAVAFEREVMRGTFDGDYFELSVRLEPIDENSARVYVYPITPSDTLGEMVFNWKSGNSSIVWHKHRRRR